jgi:alkylated DNA repair dioxygenase AlkB
MQIGLFHEAPAASRPRNGRIELGNGAWIQQVPHWLHAPHQLFDRLQASAQWESHERPMYDRIVAVPRLMASAPVPLDPMILDAQVRLQRLTGWVLDRISLALYRNGEDSVAWHGDRMGELRKNCVMAIVSLGAERRFLIRPAGGGPSRTLRLTGGDLVLMGGTIHDTFEHSVPKEAFAGPRIALMFRPSARPR